MQTPASTALSSGRNRPSWIYWPVALAFGPVLAGTTKGYGWLNRLSSLLVAHLVERPQSSADTLAISIAVHLVLPTLVLYGLLSMTRLGSWLAISKLVLLTALTADGMLLIHTGARISDAFIAPEAGARLMLGDGFHIAGLIAFGAAAALLVGSTLWHRALAGSTRWRSTLANWLREI